MPGRISFSLIAWLSRHPSEKLLLALHDGELSAGLRARTLSHIEKCGACRLRFDRMEQSWALLAASHEAAAGTSPLGEELLLSRIRDSIHTWSAANLASPRSRDAVAFSESEDGRLMGLVLGIYLGRRAAAGLLGAGYAMPPSRRECLFRAGSILSALLGGKGAMAVEAQLLRMMDRLPESGAQSSFS